jgi:D-glycero-D-manno-heptose 1,7-bisphosphate phosphatase
VSDTSPRRLHPGYPRAGRGPAAVFLDRDGVLNDVAGDGTAARSPRTVAEVRIAEAAVSGVDRLRKAGYLLVVVTNQPDVARGNLDEADAMAMTRVVVEALGLDDAYVCIHDAFDGCACRKPQPGLLTTAAEHWGIALSDSWLIGDRWIDVAAGSAAGVRTVLIGRPYSDDPSGGVSRPPELRPDAVVATLENAVATIVEPPA